MSGNFVSDNCRVVPVRMTATTQTKLFTATGYTQLIGIRVVNFHASSTPVIFLQWQPGGGGISGGTNYYLQANYVMPVATALWIPYEAFSLGDKDELYGQVSIANTVDILVSVAEIPGRSG